MDTPVRHDNADNNRENPIGRWSASVEIGRKAILIVKGVIPTDGNNRSFTLRTADTRHVDPSILILEVDPDVAVWDGDVEAEAYYSEILDRYDQYTSVLVKSNGRHLALFDVEKKK